MLTVVYVIKFVNSIKNIKIILKGSIKSPMHFALVMSPSL